MPLDLSLLQAFVAVAERRSFTRAAQALNRTQSAVSAQVKRLEDQVEAALFHRTTTRVALSPAGENLLGYARRMLELEAAAIDQLRRHRLEGTVRIGTMDDYGTLFVPALLRRFAAVHPRVRIEMETGLTMGMLDRLGSDFDLVLAMHPAGQGGGTLLRREKAVWVAKAGYVADAAAPLPLALYPSGCLFRRWATEALDGAGRAWRLAFVGHGLAAVAAVAAEGLAVTVVKAGAIPRELVPLKTGHDLPALPQADIRLHRSATCPAVAGFLGDQLAAGLGAGSWIAPCGQDPGLDDRGPASP